MVKVQFFSDSNLQGFVQSIAHHRPDMEVDEMPRIVTLEDSDMVRRFADDWGGVVSDD